VSFESDLSEGDINRSAARRQWEFAHLDAETRRLLEEDSEVFLHQALSTPCLNALSACRGSFIEDLQGRRFLDFHGNSVHQVGFGNPAVVAAIVAQVGDLSFCPRRYTNIPAVRLAQRLAALAPGSLKKVLFAPGGTTAVGMALKLARVATGRFKTVSMWDSFHGASLDAISIGGEAMFRKGIGPLLPGAEHVPPPDPFRCLFDPAGRCGTCGLKCAAYVEYVLAKEEDIAAVIAEPIRATAVIPPPPGYWERVRRACDRHGALLIFDETAVGLGRTGSFFAADRYGVEPDIITIGKGLGGGILPLAAIIARRDLDVAAGSALGHYTHEKNPVACAAGLAAVDFIVRERLPERALELGRYARDRLAALMPRHPLIGEVRGEGLMFGADLVTDAKIRTPAAAAAENVMYASLARGLSFKVSQGSFLTLNPPLTVEPAELDAAIDILDAALGEVESRPGFRS
jgi:4-aminobutyrate aminotransferase